MADLLRSFGRCTLLKTPNIPPPGRADRSGDVGERNRVPLLLTECGNNMWYNTTSTTYHFSQHYRYFGSRVTPRSLAGVLSSSRKLVRDPVPRSSRRRPPQSSHKHEPSEIIIQAAISKKISKINSERADQHNDQQRNGRLEAEG